MKRRQVRYTDIPTIHPPKLPKGYVLPEDLRGKLLENLYLEKVISTGGGMSVVMLGLDILDNGKKYAVKILIPEDTSTSEFKSEKAAYELLSKHPSCDPYIVCVFKASTYPGLPRSKTPGTEFTKDFVKAFRTNPGNIGKRMIPVENKYHYFQMELMDMDLHTFLKTMRKTHGEEWHSQYPSLIEKVIRDIFLGIQAVHDHLVAHLDLKPGNILLQVKAKATFFGNPQAKDVLAKVGDLGFVCSGRIKVKRHIRRCTPWMTVRFAPPEVIRMWHSTKKFSLEIAKKADMWSAGVILGLLLFRKDELEILDAISAFFEDRDEDAYIDAYNRLIDGSVEYDSGHPSFDTAITDLFYKLIRYHPSERPSIAEALTKLPCLK